MKTLVLAVCVAATFALVVADGRDDFKRIHKECQDQPETHVADEVFEAVKKGEPFDRHLVGAHMVCMFTKLGTLNADGTVNKEKLKKGLAHEISDEAKLEEVTNKCAAVHDASPGETALKLSKCIKDGLPRHSHSHEHHG